MPRHLTVLTTSMIVIMALGFPAPPTALAFDWLGRVAADADGLKSEDPRVRLHAVRALQEYAIEWTQDFLLETLNDPDIDVRSEAGRALAKHQLPEVIPVLMSWLTQPDSQSKEAAANILGQMAAVQAVPALVRTLGDADFHVRMRSTIALGTIGGESVIVPLTTRLEDPNSDVRYIAVKQLQHLAAPQAIIPMIRRFNDSNLKVRIAAHEAVGSLGDATAVPALLRAFQDPDHSIRIASVTSLGNLHSLEALPPLLASFKRAQNTALSGKIAHSMAQIAKEHPTADISQRALSSLTEALVHNRKRSAAKEALITAGASAVPWLIAHLEGRIGGDPNAVVEILLEIADRRATPAVIAELDRERVPQILLLSVLKKTKDPRALLAVLTLVEDKIPSVRLQAMHTLTAIVREDSEASDIMAKLLEDSDLEIRKLAALHLGQMKARSAAPALEALVRNASEFDLRAVALSSLAAIRAESSTALALSILEKGPSRLRPLAVDVLCAIASPTSIPRLQNWIDNKHLPWRDLAINAIGAALDGKSNQTIARKLREIALASDLKNTLAAIEALTRMNSDSQELFRSLAESGNPERRRAGLFALGATGEISSEELLREALHSTNDSVAATAAWSLAKLPVIHSQTALRQAIQRRGRATAVNASAALAVHARAIDQKFFISLLQHQNSLVRVNALAALTRRNRSLAGNHQLEDTIETILKHDTQWLVRVAAIRALSQSESRHAQIQSLGNNDHHEQVRLAARNVHNSRFVPSPATHRALFRIVDPQTDDTPVPGVAYFFVGSDGLARVGYSSDQGRIVFPHFPVGPYRQGALEDQHWR